MDARQGGVIAPQKVRVGQVVHARVTHAHVSLRSGRATTLWMWLWVGPSCLRCGVASLGEYGFPPMACRRWETVGLLLENRVASRSYSFAGGRPSAVLPRLWITCVHRHNAWRPIESVSLQHSNVVVTGVGPREGRPTEVACPRATVRRGRVVFRGSCPGPTGPRPSTSFCSRGNRCKRGCRVMRAVRPECRPSHRSPWR